MPKSKSDTTTFWFAEHDGRVIPDCGFTRQQVIQQIMDDYSERDWVSLKKAGYTVAKYKLVRLK